MKLLTTLSRDEFSHSYQKVFNNWYPAEYWNPSFHSNIVSNYVLHLDLQVYNKCQEFISTFYKESRDLPENISQADLEICNTNTANHSVLMGYDFHITADGVPKLIEVNTNAAGYLPTHLAIHANNISKHRDSNLELLKKSFHNESHEFYENETNPNFTAIIDEDVKSQNMHPEFLMYKHLLQTWGWESNIFNFNDLKYNSQTNRLMVDDKNVDFIYNRYCDFLLSDEISTDLRSAFINKSCVFSPNPKEYLLAADKSRLIDLTEKLDKEIITSKTLSDVLLKTYDTSKIDKDDLWNQRKKLFFKPKQSYGGKESYRGSSITRSVFARIVEGDHFLAQEFSAAPKVKDNNDTEWKFDLRFYVYKDEIHQFSARLYQGQVTNFQTPSGGFTPVVFE